VILIVGRKGTQSAQCKEEHSSPFGGLEWLAAKAVCFR
jgi:hypothetical protein